MEDEQPDRKDDEEKNEKEMEDEHPDRKVDEKEDDHEKDDQAAANTLADPTPPASKESEGMMEDEVAPAAAKGRRWRMTSSATEKDEKKMTDEADQAADAALLIRSMSPTADRVGNEAAQAGAIMSKMMS
jgi:hypothetical protein